MSYKPGQVLSHMEEEEEKDFTCFSQPTSLIACVRVVGLIRNLIRSYGSNPLVLALTSATMCKPILTSKAD